ncbi:MAG: hypothetical protein ACKVZJ_04205 [Phycisphaerales bacterium]
MSKFLRKYKVWILAVGGSLLMIAWLFPQAMQQFGSMQLSSTAARWDGGKLTVEDFQNAQQEIAALSETSPVLLMALGLSDGQRMNENAVDHWMLLSREAERQGFVGGVSDGRGLIEDLATQLFNRAQMEAQMRGQPAPQLAEVRQLVDNNRIAAGGGRPEKWIDTTLAKASGVLRMMQAGRSLGTVISAKESTLFAWELFDAAVADLVIVPASSVASELPAPDEARLAAHFEQYKNVSAGTGEMGFGYKREAAVRVEWITVARQAITDAMIADPIEVNKFWRQNKASFGDNYSEVKGAVEAQFKRDQAEKRIEAVKNAIDRQKMRLYGPLENEGRYKKLPADWLQRAPSLEVFMEGARAALDLPAAPGMIFATPADSTFRTANELRQLPGIGMTGGRVGEASFMSFAQAAAQVRELGVNDQLHGAQLGTIMGPVVDVTGMSQNEYYFRVVEARPEGPPASIDEVLERVKADVADKDGFELLKNQAGAYRERLIAKGVGDFTSIPGVRAALDTVVTRETMTPNDATMSFTLNEANTPAVREAVMKLVENWDPKADVASLGAGERSVVVPDPAARGLILAVVKARRPLTSEKLAEAQNEVQGRAFQKLTGTAQGMDPFAFDPLRKRLNYKPVGAPQEPETAPAAEPKQAGQ